jgi:hypothetical protein
MNYKKIVIKVHAHAMRWGQNVHSKIFLGITLPYSHIGKKKNC